MIQHDTQYEQVLRRALHAAADGIEPEANGLERIRARLTMPAPLPVAWLNAGYADVSGLTMGWLQTLGEWLRAVTSRFRGRRGRAAGTALTARRAVPAPRPALGASTAAAAVRAGKARRLRQAGRARPLAAAGAVAVFVTVCGALVLATLPGQLSGSLDGIIPFLGSSSSAGGHSGSAFGGGRSLANGTGPQHGWSTNNTFPSNGPGVTFCPPPFKAVAPGNQGSQPGPGQRPLRCPGPAAGHPGACAVGQQLAVPVPHPVDQLALAEQLAVGLTVGLRYAVAEHQHLDHRRHRLGAEQHRLGSRCQLAAGRPVGRDHRRGRPGGAGPDGGRGQPLSRFPGGRFPGGRFPGGGFPGGCLRRGRLALLGQREDRRPGRRARRRHCADPGRFDHRGPLRRGRPPGRRAARRPVSLTRG